MTSSRDHGGRLDAAIAEFGGVYEDWIDLSTGINPDPFPVPEIDARHWTDLPDQKLIGDLEDAARIFWDVPKDCEVVATAGASAAIACLPKIIDGKAVHIPAPTYNEHAAAFSGNGWRESDDAETLVIVNPNNPDGRFWDEAEIRIRNCVIDESFCDVSPQSSLIQLGRTPNYVILKSFGKFWGLAGLRLGFAICLPDFATRLRDGLGPWQVSGPACQIGTLALSDRTWADQTRVKLAKASDRLDGILTQAGLTCIGGTSLFRLASAEDANALYRHLASNRILTRIFPYSENWVRFGLPFAEQQWARLDKALKTFS